MFLQLMSLHPKLIRESILTNDSSYGFHIVKIFIDGVETEMIIDTKILCNYETDSPAFLSVT